MTRSAAAQEPSMDEILASIRRIIETGDERPDPVPAARTRAAGTASPIAAEPLAPLAAPADPAFEETPAAPPHHAFTAADEEDLAQRLRDELEGAELAAHDQHDDNGPVADEDDEMDAAAAPAGRAEWRDEDSARIDDPAPGSVFVAANSDSRRLQDYRAAVIDDLAAPDGEGGMPLVSGRTGELVGASFDELARAIREGELRSLEDMAQDLLRPMLQDWLDDNLPKLVERLVREEIERVARGGRR